MRNTIEISSHSNPKFKHLKSLSKARNRRKEGVFLMEGRLELERLLATGRQPNLIVFCGFYTDEQSLRQLVGSDQVDFMELSRPLFDELAYQQVAENFIALFDTWKSNLQELVNGETIVLLEGVEKPGNFGAILRTCNAAGVSGIIVAESEIDLFNPNVLRNSRGAFVDTPCVFCSNEEALTWLSANDYTIQVTSIAEDSISIDELPVASRRCFVFGAEATGITTYWEDNAHHRFMLPMKGVMDSLNLSVTVGIVVYNAILNKKT